jgi:hypothetical protein
MSFCADSRCEQFETKQKIYTEFKINLHNKTRYEKKL